MNNNYLQQLPLDTLKKTFFNLKIKDILNYCSTNLQAQKLCNDNNFC